MSSLVRENGRSGGHVRGEGDGFEVAALSWHVHLNGDPRGAGRESAVNLPLTVAGGFCVVGDGRTSPLSKPGDDTQLRRPNRARGHAHILSIDQKRHGASARRGQLERLTDADRERISLRWSEGSYGAAGQNSAGGTIARVERKLRRVVATAGVRPSAPRLAESAAITAAPSPNVGKCP